LLVDCNYSCKSSSDSVAPLEITATKPAAEAEKKLADKRERERERARETEEKLQELPVLLLLLELEPPVASRPGVIYNQFPLATSETSPTGSRSTLPRPVPCTLVAN
jgi:hypothetical protein